MNFKPIPHEGSLIRTLLEGVKKTLPAYDVRVDNALLPQLSAAASMYDLWLELLSKGYQAQGEEERARADDESSFSFFADSSGSAMYFARASQLCEALNLLLNVVLGQCISNFHELDHDSISVLSCSRAEAGDPHAAKFGLRCNLSSSGYVDFVLRA